MAVLPRPSCRSLCGIGWARLLTSSLSRSILLKPLDQTPFSCINMVSTCCNLCLTAGCFGLLCAFHRAQQIGGLESLQIPDLSAVHRSGGYVSHPQMTMGPRRISPAPQRRNASPAPHSRNHSPAPAYRALADPRSETTVIQSGRPPQYSSSYGAYGADHMMGRRSS